MPRPVLAQQHGGGPDARVGDQRRFDSQAGSIRTPRSLICWSARPRNSSSPPARCRTRSPVRYMRSPADPNGSSTNRSAVSSGCPRYPSASWSPARYSSPTVPGGTGRSAASRTWVRVFHTGRPMGTVGVVSAAEWAHAVTSTAASVGPYRLCTSAPVTVTARAASSVGSASPLQMIRRSAVPRQGAGSCRQTWSIDGTKWASVTRSRRTSSARRIGSWCAPGGATTITAPLISGRNSSHTDTSNPTGVLCSTRSCAPVAYSSRIHSSRLQIAPCETTTPLGRPVVPEVWMT